MYRLGYNDDVVGVQKWAVGKAVRAGLAVGGRISNRSLNREQRSAGPFQPTYPGRRQLAFLRVCSCRVHQGNLEPRGRVAFQQFQMHGLREARSPIGRHWTLPQLVIANP